MLVEPALHRLENVLMFPHRRCLPLSACGTGASICCTVHSHNPGNAKWTALTRHATRYFESASEERQHDFESSAMLQRMQAQMQLRQKRTQSLVQALKQHAPSIPRTLR
jgi:hypothetical protein